MPASSAYDFNECIIALKDKLKASEESSNSEVVRDMFQMLAAPNFLAFLKDHRKLTKTVIMKAVEMAVNDRATKDLLSVIYAFIKMATGVFPDAHLWGDIAGLDVRRMRNTPVPTYFRRFRNIIPVYDLICRMDKEADRSVAAAELAAQLLEKEDTWATKDTFMYLYALRLSLAFVPGMPESLVRQLLEYSAYSSNGKNISHYIVEAALAQKCVLVPASGVHRPVLEVTEKSAAPVTSAPAPAPAPAPTRTFESVETYVRTKIMPLLPSVQFIHTLGEKPSRRQSIGATVLRFNCDKDTEFICNWWKHRQFMDRMWIENSFDSKIWHLCAGFSGKVPSSIEIAEQYVSFFFAIRADVKFVREIGPGSLSIRSMRLTFNALSDPTKFQQEWIDPEITQLCIKGDGDGGWNLFGVHQMSVPAPVPVSVPVPVPGPAPSPASAPMSKQEFRAAVDDVRKQMLSRMPYDRNIANELFTFVTTHSALSTPDLQFLLRVDAWNLLRQNDSDSLADRLRTFLGV